MLLHVHHHVEVARRPALRARFAFAREPQPLARGDAGGNLDRELAEVFDDAVAVKKPC
jgi:hypothetical protein